VGNAVPPILAQIIANAIKEYLQESEWGEVDVWKYRKILFN
jgi:hypothetical protein